MLWHGNKWNIPVALHKYDKNNAVIAQYKQPLPGSPLSQTKELLTRHFPDEGYRQSGSCWMSRNVFRHTSVPQTRSRGLIRTFFFYSLKRVFHVRPILTGKSVCFPPDPAGFCCVWVNLTASWFLSNLPPSPVEPQTVLCSDTHSSTRQPEEHLCTPGRTLSSVTIPQLSTRTHSWRIISLKMQKNTHEKRY